MKRFTLNDIRQTSNVETLVEAAQYYLDIADRLTVGEDYAFRSTILDAARRMGVSSTDLNILVAQANTVGTK